MSISILHYYYIKNFLSFQLWWYRSSDSNRKSFKVWAWRVCHFRHSGKLVLPTGFEPMVSPLSGACFNRLNYGSKGCPCKQKSYLFTCPSRAVRSFRSRISSRLLNRHRSFKLCHTVFSFQLWGWSGWQDSNLRHHGPKPRTLPNWATSR